MIGEWKSKILSVIGCREEIIHTDPEIGEYINIF